MAEIHIGERVRNKRGEIGIITAFDDQNITIDYQSRTATLLSNAFEQGYISYENAELQSKVQESIAEAKTRAAWEVEEKRRVAEEKAKVKKKASITITPSSSNDIEIQSIVKLIDPAPVYLNSVYKKDRQLVQEIFDECEKDTQTLYEAFQPKMVYPKLTSHSRSKYCVGFLTKYLDTYVFRVFSRNDVYKRRVKTGVTVMESNTAEVLRVLQINGKLYHFSKNISFSEGRYNNAIGNHKWRGSDMGTKVFLNEVICNCDCGYLNGFVSDKSINIQAFLFINLLFLALVNNKAEIVFKNKAFASTYGIQNFTEYLEDYTSKQIDFASKNDVIHALPFIKKFGISDIELLRDLDDVMERRRGDSIYARLEQMVTRLGDDCSNLDRRLMNFVKNVENFNAALYCDYLQELNFQPNAAITIQDIFDRNYVERHNVLFQERLARYREASFQKVQKDREEYSKAAKNLSWIDREENGYFIIVPKTIEEFKVEGDVQHNCVYSLKYYRKVVEHRSIIVFLRQEKCTPYVTIEYDYNTFKVLQALGKYNKKIDSKLYQYIVDLGKQLYYEMHTQQ